MIGAGAVGGFVDRRLVQAGREVDFLVRPGRAAELNQHGLRIVDGTRTEIIDVRTVTASSPAEPYDLVLVGVKAQALSAAIKDFTAAVGPDTVVMPFLNGISHIDTLGKAVGRGTAGAHGAGRPRECVGSRTGVRRTVCTVGRWAKVSDAVCG